MALGASALPAHGQARLHRVAWFTLGDRHSTDGYFDALREGLRDLGYQEGRDLAIEVHAANFSAEAGERIGAQLIALRPAVIVAQGPATRVMARQPPTVPVVFGFSGDPVEVSYHPGRNVADLQAALAAALVAQAEALVVFPDALTNARRGEIVAFSLKNAVPAISGWSRFADSGLLLSYGPNLRDSWYRIAHYVDRILKGADAANLPIELPRSVELVVNLTTARTLGIRIPQAVLARADRVIE